MWVGEDLPQKTKLGEAGKGLVVSRDVVNQRVFFFFTKWLFF